MNILCQYVTLRNAQRGRENNRAPYTYTEVKGCLVQYLNRKGKAESSLYGIDPYGGRKPVSYEDRVLDTMAEKVERRLKQNGTVSSFQAPVTQQRQQQRQSGHQNSGQGNSSHQGKTKEDKIRDLCVDFNSSVGCGQPHGSCSKGKHLCSNASSKNYVCMRRHSAMACRNPQMSK